MRPRATARSFPDGQAGPGRKKSSGRLTSIGNGGGAPDGVLEAGKSSRAATIYQPAVNRLSHELGGPLALLRGYFSMWLDRSLDPFPWSTVEEIATRFAAVDRLASSVAVLIGSINKAGEAVDRDDLSAWIGQFDGQVARPIRELKEWFQSKNRNRVYELSFASAHAALVCERNAILLHSLATQLGVVQSLQMGDRAGPVEPLELSSWLRRSVHEMAPAITCFGHTLALDTPNGGAVVRANPVLLSIALLHLLDNAQKFARPQTPIRIGVFASPRTAGFMVEDNGPGLPREFELQPFGRVDDGLGFASPGMGLGLYITSLVAEMLQGRLTFHSIENVGTTFRIEIPVDANG